MFGLKENTTGKQAAESPSARLGGGGFLFPFPSVYFITYATAYFPLLLGQLSLFCFQAASDASKT